MGLHKFYKLPEFDIKSRMNYRGFTVSHCHFVPALRRPIPVEICPLPPLLTWLMPGLELVPLVIWWGHWSCHLHSNVGLSVSHLSAKLTSGYRPTMLTTIFESCKDRMSTVLNVCMCGLGRAGCLQLLTWVSSVSYLEFMECFVFINWRWF